MELTVNGKKTQHDDGLSVASLLASLEVEAGAGGVAVAVNGAVVPRDRWSEVTLAQGDRVEVIHAVQGG
jgi:sulfur carrier protein